MATDTQYSAVSCICDRCKEMCNRPCWGTVAQFVSIIEAGHAARLMLDYWPSTKGVNPDFVRKDDYNIYLLCGASLGCETSDAPWVPGEFPCVFLTDEDLCGLHDAGLKPLEGQITLHNLLAPDGFRVSLVSDWATKEGRALVGLWSIWRDTDDFPQACSLIYEEDKGWFING